MWKPMLPKLSWDVPANDTWVYEVKYDGYRALLNWTKNGISLISRNGNNLTNHFPEIIAFCNENKEKAIDYLPLQMDGEIVILNSPLQANFPLLQQRGRLGQKEKRELFAKQRPANFLCFDLLELKNQKLHTKPYVKRKEQLKQYFLHMGWETEINTLRRIGYIPFSTNYQDLWRQLQVERGEGIVAKHLSNPYEIGKRVDHWLKIKNWRNITGVVTAFDMSNQYFTLAITQNDVWKELGVFKHGLQETEYQSLTALIMEKGEKTSSHTLSIPPGITVQINCLHVDEKQIREAVFDAFRFDIPPEECTEEKLNKDLAMLPKNVEITNPDKPMWPRPLITKLDLILHLRNIAPFMLPRLYNKKLTLIRYPHGITDESFFQKHRAPHTPSFVESYKEGEEDFILCNNLESLIWIGNQGTIEFHIPFQKVEDDFPDEIVFDLDPPSRDEFHLSIKAAKLLKEICDYLELITFVKTSGNKGLQIHIPIPNEKLSFDQTRDFTEAIANLLVQHNPEFFTIERLKKNRGNRLYVDYVQHAEGKTIIAPYSPRATKEGTVSTPLFWDEVNENLKPTNFTIMNVYNRIVEKGCPWAGYEMIKKEQNISKLIQLIKK